MNQLWVWAWVCNLFALLVTVFYWYFSVPLGPLIRAAYMGGKAAFVALLIQGAWALKRPGARLLKARYLVAGLLGYAALCAALPLLLAQVGVVQHTTMGLVLLLGGVLLDRQPRERGLGWLAAGLFLRGGLALVEAVAYGTTLLRPGKLEPTLVARAESFLSAHSSLDSGLEACSAATRTARHPCASR